MSTQGHTHIESIIIADCDCCGAERALTRCWVGNVETFACAECRGGDNDFDDEANGRSCIRLVEIYEGEWRIVKNGDRWGWWRFHDHYDRDGYCDNPGRGY